jgi:hypothetical protein
MLQGSTETVERRRGRIVWRLLLAAGLLLAQLHALDHAVAHELGKDRLDHACLLCAAADELGSGLPAVPPPVAARAPLQTATFTAISRHAAIFDPVYSARAPPVSAPT